MSTAMLRLYATVAGLVQDRFNHRKDRGATAVEYGLLVGLIAVVIIAAVAVLGPAMANAFQDIADELTNAVP